jgi:hypothetical protein
MFTKNKLKNIKIDLVYSWGDMTDEKFLQIKENLAKNIISGMKLITNADLQIMMS